MERELKNITRWRGMDRVSRRPGWLTGYGHQYIVSARRPLFLFSILCAAESFEKGAISIEKSGMDRSLVTNVFARQV